MSDHPQGDGWWIASDQNWYPPELHPDYQQPAPPSSPGAVSRPAEYLQTSHGEAWVESGMVVHKITRRMSLLKGSVPGKENVIRIPVDDVAALSREANKHMLGWI